MKYDTKPVSRREIVELLALAPEKNRARDAQFREILTGIIPREANQAAQDIAGRIRELASSGIPPSAGIDIRLAYREPFFIEGLSAKVREAQEKRGDEFRLVELVPAASVEDPCATRRTQISRGAPDDGYRTHLFIARVVAIEGRTGAEDLGRG